MNRHFSKEDIQMANRHMERCSSSGKYKSKPQWDITSHLSEWLTLINNSDNNRCWRGCGERGSLLPCCWECKLMQPLWRKVWRFLRKLKLELPYDPAIALLGIYPKDTDVLFRRGTCTPTLIAVLSTIAKVWKEPKMSIDGWMDKEDVCVCVCVCVYIYCRVLLSSQKEWHLAICNYIDGTGGYYVKQN